MQINSRAGEPSYPFGLRKGEHAVWECRTQRWRRVALLPCIGAMGIVAGCTTVLHGTTQTISVDSAPTGAVCVVASENRELGRLVTPASIDVPRSRAAIVLHCRAAGFVETDAALQPVVAFRGTGSPLLDLPLLTVDASSGSIYEYPAQAKVRLIPEVGLAIGGPTPAHYPDLLTLPDSAS